MKTVQSVMLILVVVMLGCGGSKPEPEVDLTAEPAEEATGAAEPDIWFPAPHPYEMTVGDRLTIRFFYYPEYNVTAVVRSDGMVTVPLVGDVKADKLKPAELADTIRTRYAEVLAEPEVSVIVTESGNQRFFIFGEVGAPGAYAFRGRMTLIDAIAEAGGIELSGRKDNIILMRKTDDGNYAAKRIDLDAKVRTGDSEMIYLVATDVIYIPMSAIAKLDTFVDQFFNKLSPAWRFYILARETVNAQGGTIIGR